MLQRTNIKKKMHSEMHSYILQPACSAADGYSLHHILHARVCTFWLQMKYVPLLRRKKRTIQSAAQVITNLAFQVRIICLRNISAKLDLKWVQLWSQFRGVYGWMKDFLAQKEKVINIQNAGKQKKEIFRVKRGKRTIIPFSIGLL